MIHSNNFGHIISDHDKRYLGSNLLKNSSDLEKIENTITPVNSEHKITKNNATNQIDKFLHFLSRRNKERIYSGMFILHLL
jgi:hypothetical protein